MLTKLIRRMSEHSENFNKKAGNITKEPTGTSESSNGHENTARNSQQWLDDSEEGSTVTQPACHSCWARAQESRSPNYSFHTLQPRTPSRTQSHQLTCSQETPLQGEARWAARVAQLTAAREQNWATAKTRQNKQINESLKIKWTNQESGRLKVKRVPTCHIEEENNNLEKIKTV